ncbi:MAG: type II restriction endonuclease [Thermoproteota archaeon]
MNEVEEAIKTIPELSKILENAVKTLKLDEKSSEDISRNFEQCLLNIESMALKIYKEYEGEAFKKAAELWINNRKEWISNILREKGDEGIKDILTEFIDCIREMEFRVGQMRKARGGKTFESIVKILLNLAGVPCEEPHKETKKILKRIDLVSPNAETARGTPDKAIFIATKRTLRERWKQVVPEHMKGARLYLVTINGELSEEKAKEINEAGMFVYVRDELKEASYLKDKPWVRRLSDLPKDIKNATPKPT